jgi:hypothetical protein
MKHLPEYPRIAKRWSCFAWDRPNMNRTHRKGKRLAKKISRRARRRYGRKMGAE